MRDNTSPYSAAEYDEKIQKTLPFYECFHDSAIDLIKTVNPHPPRWLDTGCGTGALARKAIAVFEETTFYLADPSEKMIAYAKDVTEHTFLNNTVELDFPQGYFDVVTAILSHHYMEGENRRLSVENCFRMLKPGGIYITFENIRPFSEKGTQIFMRRWMDFKKKNDSSADEKDHYRRLGMDYFPMTILEQIDLLRGVGFKTVELFWMSYMQGGFFALK